MATHNQDSNSYDHILSFPKDYQLLWREIGRHASTISIWSSDSNKGDEWIYIGILKRAAELIMAISILLSLKNFAAATILDRALMELKFRASWLSEDKDKKRLHEYSNLVESEKIVLKRKMKAGKSFTSQIMSLLFSDSEPAIKEHNQPERTSISQLAEQADLAFDYDIPYWTESLFVHSHPLSMAMYRSKSQAVNDIFSEAVFEMSSGEMLPFMMFGGSPSTFVWILEYMQMCFTHPITPSDIQHLRELQNLALNNVSDGVVTVSPEVPQGSLTVISGDEKITFQRRQRKP